VCVGYCDIVTGGKLALFGSGIVTLLQRENCTLMEQRAGMWVKVWNTNGSGAVREGM
jgi:hypothetical protein